MLPETGLDDAHQTCVYIPHQEPAAAFHPRLATSDGDDVESYTLFPDRDLPDGYELRLAAYKMAWSKCLQRVQQELIHALHAPIVHRVAELVNEAYADTLPGLPYTELLVISVTVFGTSSSIFDEISARLETEGQDGLFDDNIGTHIVTHLFPQDCTNLTSAIKTLITGFINKTEEDLGIRPSHTFLGSVKRKPASSLSTVDINLLQTWFDALCESRESRSNTTRLVVILHDFEQFDPLVMQDLFEISRYPAPALTPLTIPLTSSYSLAIPRLPLVFVLSITSPSTPSYIHATYPRSTLSRFQVRSCSFSASQDVLHDIVLKTFFDVDFDPDLVLGPAAIEFLLDFSGRHSPSLDALVSILQLVHMKHFEEPLTVFLAEEILSSRNLANLDSAPFLDYILARVQGSSLVPDHSTGWLAGGVDELLVLVRTARLTFQKKSKMLRVSFRLLLVVQRFMVSLGHKSEKNLPELMCAALRGRLWTSYRYLCTLVKKLQADQLDELLSDLYDFFSDVPAQVRDVEREIVSRINTACSVHRRHNNEAREARDVAETVGDWLLEYFQHRLVTFEELPLWDVWYTGSTPFPSELFNPSLRASIFSGLLHPQDYGANSMTNHDADADDEETIWDMPDTSILFQRYLESGKMINVFDWFESFTVVLETQKRHVRRNETAREAFLRTPTRGKEKQRHPEEDDSYHEESEERLEKWRLEVQARFIRSLHELDYIGLIKHTGRKADHVMRTVFDVPG
ncbi:hypothetical protein J3R83DRAFT_13920 [Lanmaoa asiatica]|nr:hypothetical protein J3R83DRAFT_13920 [Lanmaoa asiatica]